MKYQMFFILVLEQNAHLCQMKRYLLLLFILPSLMAQKSYFQQEVNHEISVKLNDVKHELSAFETVTYINHSPDTLKFIYFHLWANAYKDNSTALVKQKLSQGSRDLYFAKDSDRGFIDSLDFKVNNVSQKIEYDKDNIDICKVFLDQSLPPGQAVIITTPFHVKIPNARFSRLGHTGQAYYVTQWFPKPAVYDMNGWNQMPYLDQGEFYSEFGDYDVSITLPKNYVMGATGNRQENDAENAFLLQKVKETESKIAKLGSGYKADMSFPESDAEYKTIRFRQEKVHDFAWFADKRFNILRGEMLLPHTKRSVNTWSYFTDANIDLWKNSISYLSDATFYYSLWNGDYAYDNVSAVDGTIAAGGGMEYPTITIIGQASSPFELDVVITHEVGHNWFYGMLGSNERKNPWMDEGINSFNELRYVKTKYPGATLGNILGQDSGFSLLHLNRFKHYNSYYMLYLLVARQNSDQADNLPSEKYSELNYGAIVYSKTAVLFNYLMSYMGENDFDIAMQFYFDQCKFKHPRPSDLRKTLEYFSEKDLSWFFNCLLGSTLKLDYKISSYRREENGSYMINVKNAGDIKGPVALCGVKDNKVVGIVWYDGFEGSKELAFPPAEVDYFRIDYNEVSPDVRRKNNTLYTKGLFRKTEPLQLDFISLDEPYKSQVFLSPAAGYNVYNGFMIGAAYTNHELLEKCFETELVPLYGTKNNTLAGLFNARWNYHPYRFFRGINIGVRGSRFGYGDDFDYLVHKNYTKIAPYVNFDFKKKNEASRYQHRLTYRYVIVDRERFTSFTTSGDSSHKDFIYGVHDVLYQFLGDNGLHPFTAKFNYQANSDMQKLFATYTQNFYVSKSKYFELRLFAGAFLYNNPQGSIIDYRFRTSGWNGSQDYLYDYFFSARNQTTGIGAAKMIENDGALKAFSYEGQTNKWLVSLNVKSPKIFKLPLLVFADIATCASDGYVKNPLFFDIGIDLVLWRDIFEVFLPLGMSSQFTNYNSLYNKTTIFQQVRFTLNIHKLNVFDQLKQAIQF